jgi:hypothetical protein
MKRTSPARQTRPETLQHPDRVTNSKPIPHIPLPFEEVMKDVLKVKPPKNEASKKPKNS